MRQSQDLLPYLRNMVLACGLALAALHQPARAQEPAPTTITIGVESIIHLPYYGLCGQDYCGYARELLDAFAREEGITIRYRPLPIPRLHRALVNGVVDAKFPAHPDWANDYKQGAPILYSDPVITFTDGYLSLPGTTGTPEKVGTIRGFTLDFSPLSRKPLVIEANAESDLFNLLNRRRVDAVYTNIGVLRAFLGREGIAQTSVEFRRDLPYRKSQYFMSSATNPTLISRFNAWMARSVGAMKTLQDQHGIQPID